MILVFRECFKISEIICDKSEQIPQRLCGFGIEKVNNK